MKLLIFSTEFPPGPGGIGTHAWQLARNMVRLGWQVRVLTLQDYADKLEIQAFNHQQTFEVHTLQHKPFAVLEAIHRWRSLRRQIQNWNPDVVVATGGQAVLIAASAGMNVPFLAVWHGVIPQVGWHQLLYRWAYQRADQIVSVSQYSLIKMLEMGIQPNQPVVVTNGADADHFKPFPVGRILEFRHELGLPDYYLLLTVGNVSERKGQDIVIRALPMILAEKTDVHYIIAGLPTRQAELADLARALGVDQHVHFLGRVDQEELAYLYNACDVFVLTSRHSSDGEFEGFGIVVIEAALCGKPAVVTNNSGLVEAVIDGVTGLVVPENDPQTTARALLSLLQDASLREKMGQAAQARARREQTWETCMLYYDAVLQKLARRRLENA